MKLTGERGRPKKLGSMELLEMAAPNEPLPFDPEKDITPKQKELMLDHTSNHDQYLLALGFNAFLCPNEEKAKNDPVTYMRQQEELRSDDPLSKKSGRELELSLRAVMVGEPSAALFPFSLLDVLPEEFKKPIAEKLFAEVQSLHQKGFKKRSDYALMIAIGAEKLLPEKQTEVQAYKDWLRGEISVERVMGKLQFGRDREHRNWELLELALIALCFPDMQNQIHLDKEFWSNIKAEMKMYTESYESLYLTEVAFAATVLAKIPQKKLVGPEPLPTRLIA